MIKLKKEFHRLKSKDRLFKLEIPLIGLTGSVATGKSTASAFLQKIGCPIICADALVKKIYTKPSSLSFIKNISQEAISKDGKVNFPKLRKIFFSSDEIKSEVESYIYSQMPQTFLEELENFKSSKFIIYDVPLLFEKKTMHALCMHSFLKK